MAETKKEKFQRLAEARTNRIIEQLDILGNLSNTSNYEYTAEEVQKIFQSIEKAVRRVKRQFAEPKEFSL